jgi:hypothetical protein
MFLGGKARPMRKVENLTFICEPILKQCGILKIPQPYRSRRPVAGIADKRRMFILIIGFCILLRVILTVNYNTVCFATIDKVFYLVVSVLTTCFGP